MTTSDALFLIKLYARALRVAGIEDPAVLELHLRFPAAGDEQKAMRWLGFAQGYCFAQGVFTIDDLRRHTTILNKGDRTRLAREFPQSPDHAR